MKANEIEDGKVLMIGDLVVGCIETDIVDEATYKIPCKVTDINHYGDVICEALKPFPDELDWQDGDDFSWIEPIPLTQEILEKNGWVYNDEDAKFFPKTWVGGGLMLQGADDCGYCIVVTSDYDDEDTNNTPFIILYIHELQHALKLRRIKKEIIL